MSKKPGDGCITVLGHIIVFPITFPLWLIRKIFFWWMPTGRDWYWW